MTEYKYLPEPHSMSISALASEIEKGIIKIPQFQRDFVWTKQKSAELLDSIIKGYPIGTFIFWKTKEELRSIRNLGGLELPKTPKGDFIVYVLDGQQRLTSIFAAVKGLKVVRDDGDAEDFSTFFVDLYAGPDDAIVVTETEEDATEFRWIRLHDLLFGKLSLLGRYPESGQERIQEYKDRLNSYQFPVVSIKEAPIDVATTIFTRLNVSGKSLSMFEIMVAKTYDGEANFDLAERYDSLIVDLEKKNFGTLPNAAVLQTLALCLTKDAKKKSILSMKKDRVIDEWDRVSTAIKKSVDFLRNAVGVPVSQLLPYPAIIAPFAYYFFIADRNPDAERSAMLQSFFWRVGLGERYAHASDTNLNQDIKRMEIIVDGKEPTYDWHVDFSADSIKAKGVFATGRAYIKTLLCMLASKHPLSFRDNSQVNIRNDWLAQSNSKNYHHFFPKSFLAKLGWELKMANHILNITLVDDQLNKSEIKAKPPSRYIAGYERKNLELKKALTTHLIGRTSFGIDDDDYQKFFDQRARRFSKELAKKLGVEPME
jgi:hypothetical protein